MGRARLAPLTAVAVLAAAGCGVLVSLDGLTGGSGPDGGASDVEAEAALEAGGADAAGRDAPSAADADAGPPTPDSAPDGSPGDSASDATDANDAADVVEAATAPDAPADAPPEASEAGSGPVSCADAGVVLCEDFENGVDATKWPDIGTTNATVVVDTSLAHRGSHALHTTALAVAPDAGTVNIAGTLGHRTGLPLPQTFYERFFVYFPTPLPSSIEAFTVAQQSHAPYAGLQLEVQTGDFALTDYTGAGVGAVSTQPVTPGTWHCVEWQLVQGNAGVGQMATWVDGQPVGGLALTNLPMPDLGEVSFGIGFYQVTTQPAYELWIDDVYVDTAPVGCAK